MINLLLGAPGGGKSYEAVCYHIIPALKAGRKVITNLSLDVEYCEKQIPGSRSLIQLEQKTRSIRETLDPSMAENNFHRYGYVSKEKHFNSNPFSSVIDYEDDWKHPENGIGALFVIDECHLSLPVKSTPLDLEEWYSLHRHRGIDVLLITQSITKINRPIRELVQIVYRVRKNTSLGSSKSYVKKVQDGHNGEVTNTTIRSYDSTIFPYYKSHTLGGSATELQPNDIRPLWKHPGLIFGIPMVFLGISLMLYSDNPLKPKTLKNTQSHLEHPVLKPSNPLTLGSDLNSNITPSDKLTPLNTPEDTHLDEHPLDEFDLRIDAYLSSHRLGNYYHFQVSKNSTPQFPLTHSELIQMGYKIKQISRCYVQIIYKTITKSVFCGNSKTNKEQSLMTKI
jgi:zona occludens toxin